VQLLAVVGCSRSFGGTTGARLGYLCHTVFAASPALPPEAAAATWRICAVGLVRYGRHRRCGRRSFRICSGSWLTTLRC
jgi:hypothetical protein